MLHQAIQRGQISKTGPTSAKLSIARSIKTVLVPAILLSGPPEAKRASLQILARAHKESIEEPIALEEAVSPVKKPSQSHKQLPAVAALAAATVSAL